MLEIGEAVIIRNDTLNHLDYRYHYQGAENQLIFRYDSTPHFPKLPSFPHHKHLPDDVVESERPEIIRVIEEAMADDV